MVTKEEIKQKLVETDNQSLNSRSQRMAEVIDYDYSIVFSPIDEYLRELDKLYVNGHFMATIIFAGSIVEHLLRAKLYLVANYKRIDKATLGTLINITKRRKILPKDEIARLQIIREMRNTLVHADADSDFAQELMDAAYSDVTYDPYIQRIWFFSGSNFSLMAKTCAEIARGFAASEYKKMMESDNEE
jgi:uncharacterized protein YutE (UPF0331/DUF86 family)